MTPGGVDALVCNIAKENVLKRSTIMGTEHYDSRFDCQRCKGSGTIDATNETILPCARCDGTGQAQPHADERMNNIPRPTKPAAPEWNGEGYPPVGCECERFSIEDGQWHGPAKVFHITKLGVCFVEYEHGGWDKSINPTDFRPLRTNEQRQREELANEISKAAHRLGFTLDLKESDKLSDAAIKFFEERYNLEPKQ